MKHLLTVCAAAFVSIFLACGARGADAPSQDQIAEGQKLVQALRATRPEGNSEIRGTLIISHDGKKRVPVVCKVVVQGDTWQTFYDSKAGDGIPAERLIITHTVSAPNKYLYARAPSVDASVPEPKPIPAEQANIPFAHSDFWLTDLGTEFIFWPQQARLKGELRLGRDCYLLESINPTAPEIKRIKSFIDKESVEQGFAGILVAEGYDANSKLVKEFSLHGSSFKKVNGQWQLEKMTIDNKRLRSQTQLKFDLPKE
ncbi:MAG: hypothetical protein JWO95_3707 [Verrucomicrobiales bacterium]|nr:hypothetical protein [Verrucomicrobiales bacterium]